MFAFTGCSVSANAETEKLVKSAVEMRLNLKFIIAIPIDNKGAASIAKTFTSINANYFHLLMRFIQKRFIQIKQGIKRKIPS